MLVTAPSYHKSMSYLEFSNFLGGFSLQRHISCVFKVVTPRKSVCYGYLVVNHGGPYHGLTTVTYLERHDCMMSMLRTKEVFPGLFIWGHLQLIGAFLAFSKLSIHEWVSVIPKGIYTCDVVLPVVALGREKRKNR